MDVAREQWLGGGMVEPCLFTPEEGGVLVLENVTFSHKTEVLGCI
jgi:hypothetical protein